MEKIIEDAKQMLSEICEKYRHHDKDIMQGIDGEKVHALDVLHWVEKLNPNASLSLKLAALFHDIDRIVTPKAGGGYGGKRNEEDYFRHKKEHAKRGAEYIIPVLNKIVPDKNTLNKTEFLILHHDDLGREIEKINDAELSCLVTADSFAFFTSIAPKLYAAEGEERVKDKVRFMVNKMPEFAKRKLAEYKVDNYIFDKIKDEILQEHKAHRKNDVTN